MNGSKLFAYNLYKKQVRRPFSFNDTKKNRNSRIRPVKGDVVIFEVYEPENSGSNNNFVIAQVNHDYRGVFTYSETDDGYWFGNSDTCNVDINCPEGDNWQNEKQSVCLILTRSGVLGTGSLINNTANDGTPYVLSAHHVFDYGDGVEYNVNGATYWFNYESSECDGGDGSLDHDIVGASLVANLALDSGSDFCLVKLDSRPPNSFYPYYSGWYREDSAATSGVAIHHPKGDVKKISLTDSIEDTGWLPERLWKTYWHTGTVEDGSSGAPFYNQNHRIVGQYWGGYADCASSKPNVNYFGKFSTSWSGNGTDTASLQNHLAPTDTSITELPGLRYYLNDTIDSTFPVDGDIVKFKNIDIEASSNITINFNNRFEAEGTFTVSEGTTVEISP